MVRIAQRALRSFGLEQELGSETAFLKTRPEGAFHFERPLLTSFLLPSFPDLRAVSSGTSAAVQTVALLSLARLWIASWSARKNWSGCRGKSDTQYSDLGDGKQAALVMSLCFAPMDLCAILVCIFLKLYITVFTLHTSLYLMLDLQPLPLLFLAHKCTDIHVFFLWIDVSF